MHSLSLYNDVLEGDSAELLIENDNEGVKADLVLILRDLQKVKLKSCHQTLAIGCKVCGNKILN